ncbi:hypothetical protein DITRI_Ditri17bG0066600 [Diplodiscus trichospermus]
MGKGRTRGRGKNTVTEATTSVAKRKGKKKVVENVSAPYGTQGRKIMQEFGLYTNEKTGLQIFNPGMPGIRVISVPRTKNGPKKVAGENETSIHSYTGYEIEGSRIKELRNDLLGPKRTRPLADHLGTQENSTG